MTACLPRRCWSQPVFLPDSARCLRKRREVRLELGSIRTSPKRVIWEMYRSDVRWLQSQGLWQQALGLLETAQEQRKRTDAVTYGALVGACAKGQQWRAAVSLMSEADSLRLHLNVVTANMAMGACAALGEWQVALAMLSDVVASAQPDLVSYNAAINACKEASAWHTAVGLFQEVQLRRLRADAITLGAVMSVTWLEARKRTLLELAVSWQVRVRKQSVRFCPPSC